MANKSYLPEIINELKFSGNPNNSNGTDNGSADNPIEKLPMEAKWIMYAGGAIGGLLLVVFTGMFIKGRLNKRKNERDYS